MCLISAKFNGDNLYVTKSLLSFYIFVLSISPNYALYWNNFFQSSYLKSADLKNALKKILNQLLLWNWNFYTVHITFIWKFLPIAASPQSSDYDFSASFPQVKWKRKRQEVEVTPAPGALA